MHSTMAYIGDRLRQLRTERNLSQVQFAVKAGLSSGAIFELENYRVQPRYGTILKLADALAVEPSDVLGEED